MLENGPFEVPKARAVSGLKRQFDNGTCFTHMPPAPQNPQTCNACEGLWQRVLFPKPCWRLIVSVILVGFIVKTSVPKFRRRKSFNQISEAFFFQVSHKQDKIDLAFLACPFSGGCFGACLLSPGFFALFFRLKPKGSCTSLDSITDECFTHSFQFTQVPSCNHVRGGDWVQKIRPSLDPKFGFWGIKIPSAICPDSNDIL